MLIITTIYYTGSEPVRDPLSGRSIEKNLSDLEVANRKLVVVYQGSSRVQTDRNG